ncbi:guanine nucleotide-binding protein subunit alpha [Sporobolomyces salmoneus]|uniref:guanine nucleotide-binding protein subunit alpha n=1 Tax=Sporobolomyces salmoneus TaxID=183962 RepID=UPI003178024E
MQATIHGFEATGIAFPLRRQVLATFLLSLKLEEVLSATTSDFNPSVAKAISSLWSEAKTKEVVSQRSKFQLNDSAAYFFDALPRSSETDYLPTDQDILRTRIRSTGIVEEVIHLEKTKIVIVDVGGQRSERRKWIMCFENVQLLIFVAAISEYDQYLYEDIKQPRLAETLLLWGSIVNSPWFSKTGLNKVDILKEKVEAHPQSVRTFLREFRGSPKDVDSIKFHLLTKFKALHRTNHSLFCHFTTATDTTAIRPVLAAVMQTVVTAALSHLGVL